MLRFNVFGQLIGLERTATGWTSYLWGPEGQRRPAEFVVPDFIAEEELAGHLRDLFHE